MENVSMCAAPFIPKPLSAEIALVLFSHSVDNLAEEERTTDLTAVFL